MSCLSHSPHPSDPWAVPTMELFSVDAAGQTRSGICFSRIPVPHGPTEETPALAAPAEAVDTAGELEP